MRDGAKHGPLRTQDKTIGKRCYRITGAVSAANYLEVPKEARTAPLNLLGRYVYIQVSPSTTQLVPSINIVPGTESLPRAHVWVEWSICPPKTRNEYCKQQKHVCIMWSQVIMTTHFIYFAVGQLLQSHAANDWFRCILTTPTVGGGRIHFPRGVEHCSSFSPKLIFLPSLRSFLITMMNTLKTL